MTVDPLIVDCFAYDLNGKPKWDVLAALGPPWHGAIIKATQGRWYSPGWFDDNWKALRTIAGDRYGVDWFRGAYHFLEFASDGTAQADLYLRTVTRAGGWDVGDFWPIVDVELGNDGSKPGSKRNANQDATRQQIIDCTTAFAEKCTAETGRKVVLYGNGAMRERNIHDKMGCSYIWPARYTSTLPHEVYERAGFTLADLLLWQYDGDGDEHLPEYPGEPPGFGKVDISVLVHEGGIDWLRSNLFAERPA
jgi:GH25 family lysozyme M1 (1,4-beta-N-acetylmuramidase)